MNGSNIINKKTIIYLIVIILMLISIFTTYWSVKTSDGVTSHVGLWHACATETISGKTIFCMNLPDETIDTNLEVIRSLCIGAPLLIMIGLILLIRNPSSKYALMLFILGSILSVIANILWTQNSNFGPNNEDKPTLGYSWYVNLIGAVIAMISAGFIQFKIIN